MIKRVKRDGEAVPISVARGRLFELVEAVLDGDVDRVALSHKDRSGRVVLMRADALAKLEADLAALRVRVGPDPRPLAGLATIHAPDDDVVADVRTRQKQLGAAKREEIFGPDDGTRLPRRPARR